MRFFIKIIYLLFLWSKRKMATCYVFAFYEHRVRLYKHIAQNEIIYINKEKRLTQSDLIFTPCLYVNFDKYPSILTSIKDLDCHILGYLDYKSIYNISLVNKESYIMIKTSDIWKIACNNLYILNKPRRMTYEKFFHLMRKDRYAKVTAKILKYSSNPDQIVRYVETMRYLNLLEIRKRERVREFVWYMLENGRFDILKYLEAKEKNNIIIESLESSKTKTKMNLDDICCDIPWQTYYIDFLFSSKNLINTHKIIDYLITIDEFDIFKFYNSIIYTKEIMKSTSREKIVEMIRYLRKKGLIGKRTFTPNLKYVIENDDVNMLEELDITKSRVKKQYKYAVFKKKINRYLLG